MIYIYIYMYLVYIIAIHFKITEKTLDWQPTAKRLLLHLAPVEVRGDVIPLVR